METFAVAALLTRREYCTSWPGTTRPAAASLVLLMVMLGSTTWTVGLSPDDVRGVPAAVS